MRAMHDTAEDVAAELVDAERVLPAHARQRRAGPHLGEAVGDEERPDDRDGEMQDQDRGADLKAERRAPEQAPAPGGSWGEIDGGHRSRPSAAAD